MLFQLLTGRLPFEADSPLAIAYAHVQEEPVMPSSINRAVTPAMDSLVARALKKNPNERFPTAAAMRDEVLRVLSAGQTAAPSIVPGAPVSSGAGVSSAVFPPVDSGFQAPPPQSLQQPYQPSPYAPQQQTPPPHGYAYPPQQQHTPPPVPQQQHAQYAPHAPQTPPPFTISPVAQTGSASGGSGGSGNGRNTPVIVGSIVVALLAIGGLITAISMTGNDKKGGDSPSSASSASASASAKTGHKGPDTTRTIDAAKCKEATKSYKDATKVSAPDFRYKDVRSVKECIQAAGWKFTIQTRDEAVYGQDTVLEQLPNASADVPKDGAEFTLVVSTGDPQ